jgi:hypothetical protein
LATALRGLGFSVWFDASLSAGDSFSDEIDREVRSARIVLVCWSPEATRSQWVKAEAQIGFSKGNLISTYIAGPDGFEPPVPFNAHHLEDLRAWVSRPNSRDGAWLSVLRSLGRLAQRSDLFEWGSLQTDSSLDSIVDWVTKHGATSPLVIDAEGFLRERELVFKERQAAEVAARERLARVQAERQAAEVATRERQARLDAERRADDAVREAQAARRLAAQASASPPSNVSVWIVGTIYFGLAAAALLVVLAGLSGALGP